MLQREVTVDGNSVRTQELAVCTPSMVQSKTALSVKWKRRAQQLQKEAQVFYFVFKHPRTPWYAKLVAICAAGYVFSPVQLIPNFIPVIGCLDDVLVVFLGAKLLKRLTPADVLTACRELADAAEARRSQEIRSRAAVVASVAIVIVWFLAAIAASLLMAAYIHH
jgi:uncharacterized membrane protein YkvA (DUF1232 family)